MQKCEQELQKSEERRKKILDKLDTEEESQKNIQFNIDMENEFEDNFKLEVANLFGKILKSHKHKALPIFNHLY